MSFDNNSRTNRLKLILLVCSTDRLLFHIKQGTNRGTKTEQQKKGSISELSLQKIVETTKRIPHFIVPVLLTLKSLFVHILKEKIALALIQEGSAHFKMIFIVMSRSFLLVQRK